MTKLTLGQADVLIVVDVQYDFLPGGALAVPDGGAVIGPINRLARAFRHVVLTQDWHPRGHASFASSHSGRQPFETTELSYGSQVLWPDHCIQGTPGAEISRDLSIPHAQLVIRKGFNEAIDSYSGFMEADRKTSTGLPAISGSVGSGGCSAPASRRISASPGRPSTQGRPGSTPT